MNANRNCTYNYIMTRQNTKRISVWKLETHTLQHVLPFAKMRSYLSQANARLKFDTDYYRDTRQWLLQNSKPDFRTCIVFTMCGESDYRKLTFDEMAVRQQEVRLIEREGIGALQYKVRKPEELMMVMNHHYMTRKSAKLKDTRYNGQVNPIHPHRYNRNRKIPSENTIADRRHTILHRNVEGIRQLASGKGRSGGEVNSIQAKQHEMTNREFYYKTFVETIKNVNSTIFDPPLDLYTTDRPCGIVSKLDREQALTYYNIYAPDSFVTHFKKQVLSDQITSAINEEGIKISGGYLDEMVSVDASGMLSTETLNDSMFFTYHLINAGELNKPYRSFPNVYWDPDDLEKYLAMNFSIDNNCKNDIPMTYRVFGGSLYTNYSYATNPLVHQYMQSVEQGTQERALEQEKRRLETEIQKVGVDESEVKKLKDQHTTLRGANTMRVILYRRARLRTHSIINEYNKSENYRWPRHGSPLDPLTAHQVNICKIPRAESDAMNKHLVARNYNNRATMSIINGNRKDVNLTVTMSEFSRNLHHLVYKYKLYQAKGELLQPFLNSWWGFRDSEVTLIPKVIALISAMWNFDFLMHFSFFFKKCEDPSPVYGGYRQDYTRIVYCVLNDNRTNDIRKSLIREGLAPADVARRLRYKPVYGFFKKTNDEDLHTRAYLEDMEKRLVTYLENPYIAFIMPTSDHPCLSCQDFVSHVWDPDDGVAYKRLTDNERKDLIETQWDEYRSKYGHVESSIIDPDTALNEESANYNVFYEDDVLESEKAQEMMLFDDANYDTDFLNFDDADLFKDDSLDDITSADFELEDTDFDAVLPYDKLEGSDSTKQEEDDIFGGIDDNMSFDDFGEDSWSETGDNANFGEIDSFGSKASKLDVDHFGDGGVDDLFDDEDDIMEDGEVMPLHKVEHMQKEDGWQLDTSAEPKPHGTVEYQEAAIENLKYQESEEDDDFGLCQLFEGKGFDTKQENVEKMKRVRERYTGKFKGDHSNEVDEMPDETPGLTRKKLQNFKW